MSRGPIVITGGGTGGHIFPMQAIAEQLLASGIEVGEIRFVGSRRGQERSLLADSGIALTLLPGRGIQRSLAPRAVLANVGAAVGILAGVITAVAKVARWRPSVVVSVGGYASFAVSAAAVLWRRPLVLVDFDATSGAAHRALERFAEVRCTAFESKDPRAVRTGAPIRAAIESIDRSREGRMDARRNLDPPIEEGRKVVVVMTGSLGARRVNETVSGLARLWSHRTDRTLIHVTGRRDYSQVLNSKPASEGLDYRVIAFGDMETIWQLCDAAVCRAGATTIAELTALGIPSVLVPLPGAPGDHQTKNALALVSAGGARMIEDSKLQVESLASVLDEILEPEVNEAMATGAAALGRPHAAAAIARVVSEAGGWS